MFLTRRGRRALAATVALLALAASGCSVGGGGADDSSVVPPTEQAAVPRARVTAATVRALLVVSARTACMCRLPFVWEGTATRSRLDFLRRC